MFDWIVLADIHLKLYSDQKYTSDGIPLKLFEILQTFKNVCDYAKKNNIEKIAILGDVNHTKQIASVDAFSIFKSMLEDYQEIKFYIIPGNHDETAKDGMRSAIDLLKGPENIITIDEYTVIDNISFLPYRNRNQLYDIKTTDILMSHFGLSDAKLSNGKSIRNNIRLGDLKKWKKVVCGHYHLPQDLDNFHYTGSLIPLTRAEFDEKKRFMLFNSETFEIDSVQTTGYRKYYEFILDNEKEVESIIKRAKELKKSGNFVHIRNRLSNNPLFMNNEEGIHVIEEFEEEHQSRGIDSKMDDKEQMLKYMEIERVSENNQEEYLNIGLEIVNL